MHTHQQRPAEPRRPTGEPSARTAGPQGGSLAQLAAALDAAPHVAQLVAIQALLQHGPGSGPLASDPVVQRRAVTIGKGKSVSNLENFRKNASYMRLIESLAEAFGEEAVVFYLQQMFSAPDDVRFLSEQHFLEALEYDLLNKSRAGEDHTLQEQYLTRYGWDARHKAATGAPVSRGGGAPSSQQERSGKGGGKAQAVERGYGEPPPRREQIKIYRTLNDKDWETLKSGDLSCLIGKHLGDFKQAQSYLFRNAGEGKPKLLIEFILQPGAELSLFSPRSMEIQANIKDDRKTPKLIQSTLAAEKRGILGEGANPNEGTLDDKIGLKMEDKGEAGFSFGIGGGDAPKLFMSLVAHMRVIGRSDGKNVGPSAEGGDPRDRVRAAGHTFNPVDARVRVDGHCLWDTLRVLKGYSLGQLEVAAAALREEGVGITVGQDVEDTHVWPLLQVLGATGVTLVSWQYGDEANAAEDVQGDGSVVIGFARDGDGRGHFVPHL